MIDTILAGCAVAIISLLTAFVELATRFRDEPLKVLRSVPGIVYCAINLICALSLFWVAGAFDWHFGISAAESKSAQLAVRTFACAFGSSAILRASFLNLHVDQKDLSVGPGLLIQALLDFAMKSADRRRAAERLGLSILAGLDFERDAPHLVELCSYSLQTYDLDDARALGELGKELGQRDDLDNVAKMDRLGLALLDVTGEKALAAAAQRVRSDDVGEDQADPVAAANHPSRRGGADEYLAALDKALEFQPANAQLLGVRARLLTERRRFADGKRDYDAALTIAPDDPEIGRQRVLLGDASVELIQRVISLNPKDVLLDYLLARALLRRGLVLREVGDTSGHSDDFNRAPALQAREILGQLDTSGDYQFLADVRDLCLAAACLLIEEPEAALTVLDAVDLLNQRAAARLLLRRRLHPTPDAERLAVDACALFPELQPVFAPNDDTTCWPRLAKWLVSEDTQMYAEYMDGPSIRTIVNTGQYL